MDVPASQPFPSLPSLPPFLPTDHSMVFRILNMSAIPLIVFLVLICACITRIFRIGYNDHETAADAPDTDHYRDLLFQLRSHHSERLRELMQGIKELVMEASDGFVYDQTKGIKGCESGEKSSSINTGCVICLEDFKDGDVCRALPECHHVFHKECVVSWLMQSNSCPICRAFTAVFVRRLPV